MSLTIEKLQARVGERFPDSGRLNVARELNEICEDSANRSKFILKPQLWLRLVAGVVILVAIYFLVSVANRIKRQRALAALHQLRAVTQVIDMHQLIKDPTMLAANKTSSSPERKRTPQQIDVLTNQSRFTRTLNSGTLVSSQYSLTYY
ncbi:MAG: hypothetical protein ACI9P7_001324 [Candidatus Azotimanducaceae bacterium]